MTNKIEDGTYVECSGTRGVLQGVFCNTYGGLGEEEKTVEAVNKKGLRGYSDWRLPTMEECKALSLELGRRSLSGEFNGYSGLAYEDHRVEPTAVDVWKAGQVLPQRSHDRRIMPVVRGG